MHESTQDDIGSQSAEALRIAGELIDAGIPVFAAPPCPGVSCSRPGHQAGGVEYDLPARWQQTVPARVWLERWQPGWALAAVGGWAADFLDTDPRNGGDASYQELLGAGHLPQVFGVQETPSGGRHDLISPTGERKATGFLPGLDLQAGAADGQGRGFVWIAPTVKRSKDPAHGGAVRAYRWVQEPDLEWLAEFGKDAITGISADGSLDGLRLRVAAARARRADGMHERRERDGSRPRAFTPMQMLEFLAPLVTRVEAAQIGEIEEQANALACALSHFVPSMLSEDQAYGVLRDALGETAYDPAHPASGWEASKFVAVVSDAGGRAPGDWHAVAAAPEAGEPGALQEAVAAVDVASDEVSALLAEMLTADELSARKPPRYLIEDFLQYDSEAWVIGEPGSKKSFVVLDMAACVATGRRWQGHRVNPALVVFIVAEGAGGSSARVRAWMKEYEPMGDCIRFLPRPVQSADLRAWAVLVQACARLAAVAAEMGRGMLVVLDTQARVTVGLKENDATDMGIFVNALGAIRAVTGACVLPIHHTGRRGGDARGSSAIDGAQTTELKVVKKGDLYGQVITEKQKDIAEAEPINIKFKVVDLGLDEDGRKIDSLVLVPYDAWSHSEIDGGTIDRAKQEQEEALALNPFKVRAVPEDWTNRLAPRSEIDRWLLQALADIALDYGLSKSEWLNQLARKRHKDKTYSQSKENWETNFQRVTSATGPAGVAGIVRQVSGGTRWTVDQTALDAFRNGT
jgi:hypothetical protein